MLKKWGVFGVKKRVKKGVVFGVKKGSFLGMG